MGTEQGKKYYDDIYIKAKKYNRHYSGVRWLPMFKIAASLVGLEDKVLEIGCGVGQFANLLHDKGKKKYYGFDFSPIAIKKAKSLNLPGFIFEEQDIYKYDWLYDYDVIVALEVFEHIKDFVLLDKITSGSRMIISLPTFPSESHLVYFNTVNEIIDHYKNYIDFNIVYRISDWFICEGVRK